jgi:hypothetical protein
MPARIATIGAPRAGVYRLARGSSDPFTPPDWALAHDGTFGNRFDDPTAEDGYPPASRFRAIYCATQRAAAFGETVARFRPSLSLLAQLAAIVDDESLADALAGAVDPNDLRRGLIPADWRLRRRMGHTILDPSLVFVDLAAPQTMQYLRLELAPLADRLHLDDVDLSSLTGQQRRFTQGVARYVYDQRDGSGHPLYAGIRYPSRLNDEWKCWAIFDDRIRHVTGMPGFPASILPDDEDLAKVAALFNLSIEVFPDRTRR